MGQRLRAWCGCLVFVFLTTGCSYLPSLSRFGKTQTDPTSEARQRALQGDFRGAAEAYLRLASQAQGLVAAEYRMSAIEHLLKANAVNEAKAQLGALPNLSPPLQARVQLAYAQIAVNEQQNQRALEILQHLPFQNLPSTYVVSYHYLKALALDAEKQTVAALYERLALDPLLNTEASLRANHEAIWKNLGALTPAQLQQMPTPLPTHLAGWVALLQISRLGQGPQSQQALNAWRGRYPQHPAARTVVAKLSTGTLATTAAPGYVSHVALFLPLSSYFKEAAAAVRDGFMTAWYAENPQSRPSLKVYDTDQGDIVAQYQQAVQSGAQLLVGPLGRNAALALLRAYPSGLSVPTLLLYEPDLQEIPGLAQMHNLFRYSLAPEQEARQVAEQAWTDGHRVAALLMPDNELGLRMSRAFAQAWQGLGGQLGVLQNYTDSTLTSAARTVARGAADVLFLSASPSDARRIKPQLAYYGAPNLAVYSTSQVYEAERQPKLDKDLDGIRFTDMPWVLVQGFWPNTLAAGSEQGTALIGALQNPAALYVTAQQNGSERLFGPNKRLFAFGIDAYRLISYLQSLHQRPAPLDGATGQLSLDNQGSIQRQLLWAQFAAGQAVLQPAYAPGLPAPLQPFNPPVMGSSGDNQ